MFPSLFPAVWYEKSLSVRCIPWNTGCGFHTHPTHWERRWRNTVCHYGWSALHCILFSPLQCLFPFPANKQAGQEKKAVQSPVVENLARKMIACQKKKTRGEYGVSVLRFLQEVRHMVGTIKFLCQCDDIPTFAECKIIPLVTFCIYLERCFRFFP